MALHSWLGIELLQPEEQIRILCGVLASPVD